jgi:hypothetical protein
MSPASTRVIGRDVHQETMAVASSAQAHGAEGTALGPMGTRRCDLAPRVRQRPSQATPLRVVSDAGPCGDWLSRDLMHKGDAGWVVAPARLPNKAGDRVTTDRRDAVPRARRARAGALTVV